MNKIEGYNLIKHGGSGENTSGPGFLEQPGAYAPPPDSDDYKPSVSVAFDHEGNDLFVTYYKGGGVQLAGTHDANQSEGEDYVILGMILIKLMLEAENHVKVL